MVDRENTDASRRAPPPGTEEFDKFIADQTVAAIDAATSMVVVRLAAALFLLCFLATSYAVATELLINPFRITLWVICGIPWLTELGSIIFRGKSPYWRMMLCKQQTRKRAKPDQPPKN